MLLFYRWNRRCNKTYHIMVPGLVFSAICLAASTAALNPNDYGNDQLPLIPPTTPADVVERPQHDYEFVSRFTFW